MNSNMLKGKIVEKGLNVETVAEKIGIDKATFYRKLGDFEKFNIGEAIKIKEVLDLTNQEACNIFLTLHTA